MSKSELGLGNHLAAKLLLTLGALALAACSSPSSVQRNDGGTGGRSGTGGSGIDAPLDTPVIDGGADMTGGRSGTTVNGQPCTVNGDCQSGFCVAESGGSFCCESACTGTCNTCTSTAAMGQCVLATRGTDPKEECPDDGLTSCGRMGTCDGAGACEKYAAGTICQSGRCTGQTRTLASRCDGNGTCAGQGTSDCTPFKCALGDQCLNSCTSDSDCTSGNLCINGSCGKKPDGATCLTGAECNHGYCQQGVCCAGPCTGTCMSCALPGTEGQCLAVAAGVDPTESCAAMSASTCGNTGVCDGKGACAKYASGTECIAQTCVNNTKTLAGHCNDSASCVAGTQVGCAPFKCGTNNDCLSSCTADTDCVAPNTCIAGQCGKKTPGSSCTNANECQSGFCSQSVCCNADCAGVCRSCALTGSVGTCTNVPGSQDPLDQCLDQGAASCGLDGMCNGSGACRSYASGTVCKSSTCTGSTLKNASRCDGNGSCVTGSSGTCDPFLCDTAAGLCKETCASDSECTTGNSCISNSCGKKPLGAVCGAGSECASSFCAQGVCCQTACTGTCMSCSLTASLGTCTQVPAGEAPNPSSQCSDQSSTLTCGTNGKCDGAGACQFFGNSTTCAPASCSGSTYTPARTCDGNGTCKSVTSSACAPYLCNTATSTCKTTCAADTDCVSPNICQGGVCRKKQLGDPCTSAAQCGSGFCSQGYCCDSNCTATCKSCAVAGALGTCTFAPNNTDPLDHCADDGASTCLRDGMCDGAGSCRYYGSGTICVGKSCVGSSYTPARTCNGAGVCSAVSSTACDPYGCDTSANVCYQSCTASTQCVSPNTCIGSSCGKKADGQTCAAPGECNSGFCAQGVCCHTACTGTCQSCSLAGSVGTCTLVPSGTAPTPANQCASLAASTCGTDGTCDGNGACKRWPSGTICLASSCSGSTLTTAKLCDGSGLCQASTTQSCGSYQCNTNGTCKTACTSAADCVSPNTCNDGSCGPKPPGAPCTAGTECASSFCSQGVCCNVDCSGTCKSCALTGTAGTCTSVPAGTAPTPATQCTDLGAASCSTNGRCDGAGACQKYASGSTCVAANCSGSTLTPARTCTSAGTCQTVSNVACDPYGCNTTTDVCKNTCTTTADCSGTNVCNTLTGQCGKPNGSTCSAGSECSTGNCIDGVCCATTCTGLCRSCAVAGSLGTCTTYAAGADPDNECPTDSASGCQRDGTCDGAGACRLYSSSTVCAGASCTGSTLTSVRHCNGSGACASGTNSACDPYACGTGACKTGCTTTADCSGSNVCINGVCGKGNGTACSAGTECASGICAQNVCCSTACNGTCKSCALASNPGTCTNVPAGADPLAQCTDNGTASCGTDGFCDGGGACRFYTSSTVCASASCSNSETLSPARNCAGNGTACPTATTTACAPYACSAGACKTSCNNVNDCAAGYSCAGAVCKKVNGQTCTSGTDCATGFCVDGYCCNSACATACMACDVSTALGTCTNVPVNTDPHTDCAAAACNAATGVFTAKINCSGSGACSTASPTTCPNSYSCTTSGCKTTCAADADCVSNYRCVGSVCKKANGQTCAAATECYSGYCADGYCCDSACSGLCKQCNLAGSAGVCSNVPNGNESPAGECPASSCTAATGSYKADATCNGAGACTTPATTTCANNYSCTTSGCKTTCAADADCVSNYRCVGNVCKKASGQTCAAAAECYSGFCADGYCCNTACTGTCMACNLTGSQGTCSNITSGTDPATECAAASCNTATATFTAKANCNGSAACTTPSGTVCANNYNCTTSGCNTTCTADAQCATNYRCVGNACKKANGQVCATGTECYSGFCADGFCCNAACNGTCQTCSATPGTCSNITGGTDPATECAAASCNATTSTFTPKAYCSGTAASCATVTSQNCSPYTCTATGCRMSCTLDTDCATGYSCNGGVCGQANGTACTAGTQCASTFCVDGYCCNNACSGLCKQCNLAGSLGTCSNVASGSESPAGECPAAACTVATGSYTADAMCNGAGACTTPTATTCANNYSCTTAGGCKTTCTADADCVANYRCVGNACKKANGQTCAAGTECFSGNCADGVCCDTTCTGLCKQCNLAGSVGTCSNVPSGNESPAGECPAAACTVATGSYTADAMCNGAGACTTPTATTCANNYSCTVAGGCKATCTADADCVANYRCVGNACKKASGQTCTAGTECFSGNCADGVCCDTTCTGLCKQCNLAGSVGTCSNVPSGNESPAGECPAAACNTANGSYTADATCNGSGVCTTPAATTCANNYSCTAGGGCKTTCAADTDCIANYRCIGNACKKASGQTCTAGTECYSGNCIDGYCCNTTCTGTCLACNVAGSLGTCSNVPVATDPANECADNGAATCGTSGNCNGAGACSLYASGTSCGAICSDATHVTASRTCDGAGLCGGGTTTACNTGYACVSGACKTSCTGASDCAAGYTCTSNVCTSPLKTNGTTCSAGTECASSNCIDGVCCDTTCTGTCKSCALAGNLGTCSNVPNNTDPGNECADSCSDPTHQLTGMCNGNGACGGGTTTACNTGYACVSGACKTACAGAGDCATGYTCTSNVCVPLLKTNGTTCSAGTECASSNCIDGVCCDTTCTGTCTSCAVSGNLGTCSNVPNADDPDNECADNGGASCGTNGSCNGAGACALYASGTACAPGCADATHQVTGRTCDGAGVCGGGTSAACNTGYICVSGACVSPPAKLQYKCADPSDPNNNAIKPHIRIYNLGNSPLDLSTLKVRYWFTKEATTTSNIVGECDWTSINNTRPSATEVTVSRTNADRYVEWSWATGLETVPVGGYDELQLWFHKADWTTFAEANDYSYSATTTSFSDYTKVTLYLNDVLIGGVEP